MAKKKSKKKPKKNLFNRAKIDFLEYDEFLNLFTQCSKRIVSNEVDKIEKFPTTIHLSEDNDKLYNPEFLRKLRDYFDSVDSFDRLANKIVITASGKKLSTESQSKKDLAKKRILLHRLLSDAIAKSESHFKQRNKSNNNAKKIYSATIKTAMISYPPNKLSEKRFLDVLSKVSNSEQDLLNSIYKKVDGYYCSQRRINKKNYKIVAQIFFNLKHISHEDK